MQLAINSAIGWGAGCGLTFGIPKTIPVVFTLRRKGSAGFPSLKMGNTALEYKPWAKYLGVVLDRRLNFKEHVKQKCDKATGLLMAAKSYGKSLGHKLEDD